MGIIAKQTIKGTIYVYSGAILGFIISALFFPTLLEPEEIGLIGVLISYSMIFAQFGSLGLRSITTRLFPYFRNYDDKHNGFLFIALLITLVGFVISILIFFIIKSFLVAQNYEKTTLLIDYIYCVIPITFFTMVFNTLDNYNKVLYDALLGIFLKEFFQRVLILLLLIVLFLKLIDFHQFLLMYVAIIAVPAILILVILIKQKQFLLMPKLHFISKDLSRMMIGVGVFGIISSATGIITLNISRIMVAKFIDLSSTGIYVTAFFFGTLIILPHRALTKISSVIIADSWKKKDLKTINEIYFKSSLNLFIIGLLVFIGIWANIHNVFKILPEQYGEGKFVILFIALSYLFDMISGVSSSIITNSKYYRMQTYFMIVLMVLIVVLNWIFIPLYGIVGAALATALSKFFFSLMRFIFIFVKFKLQPYNSKFLLSILVAGIAYFSSSFLPVFEQYIYDIIIRSAIIIIVFGSFVLLLKISVDANEKFNQVVARLRLRK